MTAMSSARSLSGVPGRMTRRLAAATLVGLALSVFLGALVANRIAVADGDPDGRATAYLVGGIVLAVLCLLASGLLRRPHGVTAGWIVLGLTLLSAIVLPAMAFVALLFAVLWVLSLTQGGRIDVLIAQASQPPPETEPGAAGQPDTDNQHDEER